MRINYNGVDRDMTSAELTIYEQAAASAAAQQAAIEQAKAEKAAAAASGRAKLAALGLTDDEINALIGA